MRPSAPSDVVAGPPGLRPAVAQDGPEFLRLVTELAVFEKLDPPSPEGRARLLRDAFETRTFELFVSDAGVGPPAANASEARSGSAGLPPRLAGYAIVLWTYSSFLGKPTLYLEDIYFSPEHRGSGKAKAAMQFLADLALSRGAGRIEGVVLGWNERARRFYAATGAKELSDWIFFRYDEDALYRLRG